MKMKIIFITIPIVKEPWKKVKPWLEKHKTA